MRYFLLLITLLFSFSLAAQRRSGSRGQSSRALTNTNSSKPPEFKPNEVAGLIFYDLKKVYKKVSVKDLSDEGKKMAKAINTYNKSIKDIKRINRFSLNELKTVYSVAIKDVVDNRDYTKMTAAQKHIKTVLDPIKRESFKKDSLLNIQLKEFLSKKQFKKWIKFSNKIKQRSIPKNFRKNKSTPVSTRRRGY